MEKFRAGHFTCKNTDWEKEKWRELISKVLPETTDWALHTRIPIRVFFFVSRSSSPAPHVFPIFYLFVYLVTFLFSSQATVVLIVVRCFVMKRLFASVEPFPDNFPQPLKVDCSLWRLISKKDSVTLASDTHRRPWSTKNCATIFKAISSCDVEAMALRQSEVFLKNVNVLQEKKSCLPVNN